MTRSFSAFAYLTLFSLFGLGQGFLTAPANAQVTPVEGWSKVNDGTAGCTSGVCKISGGVSSGKNLFHKLEKLNTKNGTIEKVSIDNIDQTSIILANIGSDLSEISVPFEALGSKADIAILSPSGINLSDGFSTNNINKLTLSTSDQIEVGAGLFDVNNTTFEQAQNLTESINYATLTNGIPNGSLIKLSDNLSIDSDLLIVSENISIDQATVQSSNDLDINGRLYVNDSSVAADSLSVVANGLFNQLEAIYVGNSSTIETNGDISIDGTGKSESSSDDLTSGLSNGVQIADSTIRSISGNIKIKGLAGKGNYINGYEFAPSGTSYDFIDIVGDGVDMYNTSVNAINGTIEIDGTGAEGSRSMGTGIDILSSKIQAQELALNGVGAKGIEVIRDPLGVRIGQNSDIHTVGPLTITGSSGNTVKNTTTDVNFARGIYVNSSDIKSDRGMITLSGTGGSGNQVKDSHGILLSNTNIRGPRIKLMGIGGKATDVSAPNAPSLEMYNYYDQQYGNSYWNSGIFISDNNKIVSNPVNDDYGSTIILGDSSNNNGDIELVGSGGNGVDYIGGVVVADNPSLIDSGGDLTISGTSGTENDFVLDSQGVSLRGQGGGVSTSTFKAVGKITIHGRGGSGETINDGVGVHIHSANITAKDLEIKGYGGRAEKVATLTWGTGLFESTINLDGTLDIYGEGGYAKTSRTDSIASMNGGVIIFGNTFNMPNSSSVKIAGESGEGGQSAIGTSLIFNDWIVGGNTSIFGKGGDGTDVNTSAGIAIDRDVWSIQGDLILDGIGGQGVKTTANYGVKLAALSLVADSILIKGVGGNSTNTDESQANYGAGFLFSDIQAKSGNITVNGNGGTGGYDNTGVKILASNLKALNGIMDIDGVGGAGKIVQENNGVGLVDAEVDNVYNLIFFPDVPGAGDWTWLYENFDFSKFDSFIDSSNKTRYGNKIEAASIDIQGTGGIPANKNQSLKNFGLTMNDTKLISSGTMNLSGQGGDGGQSIAGINIKDATLTSSGDTSIIGIAGEGDRVVKGEGIIFDSSILTVSSANQIELTGTGSGVDTDNQIKKVNRLERGQGIVLQNSSITALGSSPNIEIQGTGGEAEDKINSKDNTGIKITSSTINSEDVGGNHVYVGKGGLGGKLNTGIVLDTSSIKTNEGTLTFTGSGGSGINIKKSLGVASNSLQLSGSKITMNGIGGESILVKNALDENNNDTFNQTADNIGVEVKGSSFNSSSGDLSITGIGGKLSVEEIVEPDQDNEIVAISVASSLEGVTLSNIKTSSTGPTFISGQAGEPIAGDKNRGTTIVSSTLQMATALPGSEKNNSVSSLDNRIEGNAYSGTNDNYGLSIASTHIESTNQDLILAGRGGLKATGEKNYGIYIGNQSSVKVGKDGNSRLLNIYGAGGDGTDMTGGILTENTSYKIDGTINMHGVSQGAGQFGDNSVEIFSGVNITTSDDTNISGDNNVNISNSSVDSGGDLNSTAQEDLNINQSEITTDENLNATAGNDVNIDESDIATQGDVTATAGNDVNIDESDIASQGDVTATAGNDVNIDESDIASQGDVTATAGNDVNIDESDIATQGDVTATAGNDVNIDESDIDSQGDVTATAGNDLTVADSEIKSNSTTLEAESIEIKDSNLSADQNLEVVSVSGLDIASSTLDASDSIALQSYSIAVENTSVVTQELAVDSTELVQKESSFDADLYSVNNEESTNDGGDQDLGFAGNALLRSAGIQVNDSTPSQSNSELTMSLAGGVNYILDDSPQQSSSNEFQASTTTSSSNTNTTTAASTGSEEGSSSDNQSVSRDASSDSESESEQTKSRDDDQVGKEDKDSSKDQKSSRGLGKGLPAQKLTVKQTKQIHQESELQSSKFVASQLGLPERPAMTIQEIQGMLTSGMSLMNSTRQ